MTEEAAVAERAELERLEAAAEDRRDVQIRWRPTGSRHWSTVQVANVPAEVAGRALHAVLLQVDPAGADPCTCPPDDGED